MVTYSTMSDFGLPVSGVQFTDQFWPSADRKKKKAKQKAKKKKNQLWEWVRASQEGAEKRRSASLYTRRQFNSLLAHSFTLSPSLTACVLSYFLQLLIVWSERF